MTRDLSLIEKNKLRIFDYFLSMKDCSNISLYYFFCLMAKETLKPLPLYLLQ